MSESCDIAPRRTGHSRYLPGSVRACHTVSLALVGGVYKRELTRVAARPFPLPVKKRIIEALHRVIGREAMTVSIILESQTHDMVSGTPGMKVAEAVKLIADKRIGAVPILDGNRVVGIMSERDLIYCVAAEGKDGLEKPVSEVMTSPPITVEPSFSILAALSLMTRRRIRHLPVVENDAIVGFISIGDLVKYRMDRIEQDAQAMRDYIQSV